MIDIVGRISDLKLRIDALELLLISRGDVTKERLEIFQGEARQNSLKAQDEFKIKQWAKIKVGSIIEYELLPVSLGFKESSLTLEVISISPNPFEYLAGKILKKRGKSEYHIGELFTTHYLVKIELQIGLGASEIISRS